MTKTITNYDDLVFGNFYVVTFNDGSKRRGSFFDIGEGKLFLHSKFNLRNDIGIDLKSIRLIRESPSNELMIDE